MGAMPSDITVLTQLTFSIYSECLDRSMCGRLTEYTNLAFSTCHALLVLEVILVCT